MGNIFAAILGQQLGYAIVFYPIVWFFIRKKDHGKFTITKFNWHLLGYFATGFCGGVIQFSTIFIIGAETVLNPENMLLRTFYIFVLPVIFAINICSVIKHRSSYYSKGEVS